VRFLARVAIGASLGAVVLGALVVFFGARTWALATGGLLGPIGFLATFFLWSADRPQDGYEQVLFDRPNIIASIVTLALLVGGGIGAGILLTPHPVDPARVAFDEQHVAMAQLAQKYQTDADLYRAKKLTGDPADTFGTHREHAQEIALALQKIELGDTEKLDALKAAAAALVTVTGTMEKCVGGDEAACLDARVAMSDYTRAAKAVA
jgi:hypothetical protein